MKSAAVRCLLLALSALSCQFLRAQSPVPEVVKLDPAKGSPFNGGVFEGWGTSLCCSHRFEKKPGPCSCSCSSVLRVSCMMFSTMGCLGWDDAASAAGSAAAARMRWIGRFMLNSFRVKIVGWESHQYNTTS